MNYKIVDFKLEKPVFVKGVASFPNIDYSKELPLDLKSSTLQAAYTTIVNKLGKAFVDDLKWKDKNINNWHIETLKMLSDSINELINSYRKSPSPELLKKIFVRIHLWGGNAGRGVFVQNGGFEMNFSSELYLKSIDECEKGNYIESLRIMNKLKYVNTAFSTKHIHFWSNGKAPIYDSIIAAVVFGTSDVKEGHYSKYLAVINSLAKEKNTTSFAIERNLFNWANTDDGIYWKNVRLNK